MGGSTPVGCPSERRRPRRSTPARERAPGRQLASSPPCHKAAPYIGRHLTLPYRHRRIPPGLVDATAARNAAAPSLPRRDAGCGLLRPSDLSQSPFRTVAVAMQLHACAPCDETPAGGPATSGLARPSANSLPMGRPPSRRAAAPRCRGRTKTRSGSLTTMDDTGPARTRPRPQQPHRHLRWPSAHPPVACGLPVLPQALRHRVVEWRLMMCIGQVTGRARQPHLQRDRARQGSRQPQPGRASSAWGLSASMRMAPTAAPTMSRSTPKGRALHNEDGADRARPSERAGGRPHAGRSSISSRI